MSTTPAGTNQPVALAQIDVMEHELANGAWMVLFKVRAGNGMVELAVMLDPDAAQVISKAIAAKADACKKKIVVPRSQIATA